MKRLLCLVLALTLIMGLCVGCGGEDAADESVSTPAAETATEAAEAPADEATEEPTAEVAIAEEVAEEATEEVGVVEVESNLFDVELTIPADYVDEGTTQESLDETVNAMGYKSATLNADGSVTYVITKAQHKEMMDGVKESIDTGLAEMVNSADYAFVSIEANDDYTEFTATVSTEELGLNETFAGFIFYAYGGMYNAFNGTPADNIRVTYISEATGEVLEVANSSEAG